MFGKHNAPFSHQICKFSTLFHYGTEMILQTYIHFVFILERLKEIESDLLVTNGKES